MRGSYSIEEKNRGNIEGETSWKIPTHIEKTCFSPDTAVQTYDHCCPSKFTQRTRSQKVFELEH